MPLVNVMINGKAYTLGCGEGEEPHLKELATLVDAKVREAQGMVGMSASDTKLMLTAALLIADEHNALTAKLANGVAAPAPVPADTGADDRAIAALDAATARIAELTAAVA
jgi:cell division protein ZapA